MVKYFFFFFLLLVLLSAGCSSAPRRELQAARMAVAQAEYAGAPKWAPAEYSAASETLKKGEELVRLGQFEAALGLLPQAEIEARQAIALTRREQEEAVRRRQAEEVAAAAAAAALAEETQAALKRSPRPLPSPPPKPRPSIEPPSQAPPATYHVEQNETLWTISAHREVYGDPLLWPLLYQANRDQIKDPRQIYPGQVLNIPRDLSPEEQEEAREKARQSEIFPASQLLSAPPLSRSP